MTKVYPVVPDQDGTYLLPHCERGVPALCPLCGAFAVLALDSVKLAEQTDNTTHVCHPVLGGCNHGFTLEEAK